MKKNEKKVKNAYYKSITKLTLRIVQKVFALKVNKLMLGTMQK